MVKLAPVTYSNAAIDNKYNKMNEGRKITSHFGKLMILSTAATLANAVVKHEHSKTRDVLSTGVLRASSALKGLTESAIGFFGDKKILLNTKGKLEDIMLSSSKTKALGVIAVATGLLMLNNIMHSSKLKGKIEQARQDSKTIASTYGNN